jgi:hypothetical protein
MAGCEREFRFEGLSDEKRIGRLNRRRHKGRGTCRSLIDLSGLRGEICEAGAFGTLEAKAGQGKADHAERGERVTATVRANDSLAGSLEMVRSGMSHGVNASFDTATECFEGVTHNPC